MAIGVVQAAAAAAENVGIGDSLAFKNVAGVHDDAPTGAGGSCTSRRVGVRLVGDQLGDLTGLGVNDVVAQSLVRPVVGVGGTITC